MTYKALVDTNVLLDAALEGRPQHEEAAEVLRESARGNYLGFVSSLSLKDFFYLCRKHMANEQAHAWIGALLKIYEIVPVNRASCQRALASANPDFEDALIEAAVADAGADYLISRDLEGFAHLPVPRVSAAEFLAIERAGRASGPSR